MTQIHGGSDGKETTCNAGDPGSILGLGKSPREGNGNPLQYSCLENPMDRGTWWAAVTLEPKKIKSVTVSIVPPSVCHEVMGPDAGGEGQYIRFW